mgnify:CR=1 FL=1
MDNNKIYVSEQEYSRLCRLDGRTDALIGYIAMAEKEYESRRNTEFTTCLLYTSPSPRDA